MRKKLKKTLIIIATVLATFATLHGIELTDVPGRRIEGIIIFLIGITWIVLFAKANEEVLIRND